MFAPSQPGASTPSVLGSYSCASPESVHVDAEVARVVDGADPAPLEGRRFEDAARELGALQETAGIVVERHVEVLAVGDRWWLQPDPQSVVLAVDERDAGVARLDRFERRPRGRRWRTRAAAMDTVDARAELPSVRQGRNKS